MKKLLIIWILSLLLLSSIAVAQEPQQEQGFFSEIISFFKNLVTPSSEQDRQEPLSLIKNKPKKIKSEALQIQVEDSEGIIVSGVKEALTSKESRHYSLDGQAVGLSVDKMNHAGNADITINGQEAEIDFGKYRHIDRLLIRNKGTSYDLDGSMVIAKADLEIYYVGGENACEPNVQCVDDQLIWYSCDNSRTINLGECEKPILEESECGITRGEILIGCEEFQNKEETEEDIEEEIKEELV